MTDDRFDRAVEKAEAARERDNAGRRARSRTRWARAHRKGFMIHATVFVAVQLLLVAIWAVVWQTSGQSYPWFLFALGGWGIGLAAHYASVREYLKSGLGTHSAPIAAEPDSGG